MAGRRKKEITMEIVGEFDAEKFLNKFLEIWGRKYGVALVAVKKEEDNRCISTPKKI